MGMTKDIKWSLTWSAYYHHFHARNNLCQWLNTCKNAPGNRTVNKKNSRFELKMGLISNLGTEKLKRWFYPGDMVTRMGKREIGAVSGRLTDNPGELACIIIIFWPQYITGRPPSVSGGRCWLKYEQRSFVIYRRNTYEQYGGYNLFQNAEFKANFSIKVWRKC